MNVVKMLLKLPVYLQQAEVVQVSFDTKAANLEKYAYSREHVNLCLLKYLLGTQDLQGQPPVVQSPIIVLLIVYVQISN